MILVTGGTGLVGAHLLFHLVSKGEKVRAIHRSSSNLDAVRTVFGYYSENPNDLFDQVDWTIGDLNEVHGLEQAFDQITTVYHCAALISFNSKDDKAMFETNIGGTSNIVNLCVDKKIRKLCFVSSVAAIGKNSKTQIYDESAEWNIDHSNYGYAISKHSAEMEVWRASAEGIPVVIVNPGVILGAGFWNNGPGAIFPKVYNGLKYYTLGTIGYVGVKDVVKAMIQLMESSIENERFILVSENRSFKDVLFMIADQFSKKRPAIKISRIITEFGWRLAHCKSIVTGKAPLLTKRSSKSLHSHVNYSSNKIETSLNYTFESIEKTIEDMCKDYKTTL